MGLNATASVFGHLLFCFCIAGILFGGRWHSRQRPTDAPLIWASLLIGFLRVVVFFGDIIAPPHTVFSVAGLWLVLAAFVVGIGLVVGAALKCGTKWFPRRRVAVLCLFALSLLEVSCFIIPRADAYHAASWIDAPRR